MVGFFLLFLFCLGRVRVFLLFAYLWVLLGANRELSPLGVEKWAEIVKM